MSGFNPTSLPRGRRLRRTTFPQEKLGCWSAFKTIQPIHNLVRGRTATHGLVGALPIQRTRPPRTALKRHQQETKGNPIAIPISGHAARNQVGRAENAIPISVHVKIRARRHRRNATRISDLVPQRNPRGRARSLTAIPILVPANDGLGRARNAVPRDPKLPTGSLPGTHPEQDNSDRIKQDGQVEEQRVTFYVVQVILDLLDHVLVGGAIGTSYLRVPSHTGFHVESL